MLFVPVSVITMQPRPHPSIIEKEGGMGLGDSWNPKKRTDEN